MLHVAGSSPLCVPQTTANNVVVLALVMAITLGGLPQVGDAHVCEEVNVIELECSWSKGRLGRACDAKHQAQWQRELAHTAMSARPSGTFQAMSKPGAATAAENFDPLLRFAESCARRSGCRTHPDDATDGRYDDANPWPFIDPISRGEALSKPVLPVAPGEPPLMDVFEVERELYSKPDLSKQPPAGRGRAQEKRPVAHGYWMEQYGRVEPIPVVMASPAIGQARFQDLSRQ